MLNQKHKSARNQVYQHSNTAKQHAQANYAARNKLLKKSVTRTLSQLQKTNWAGEIPEVGAVEGVKSAKLVEEKIRILNNLLILSFGFGIRTVYCHRSFRRWAVWHFINLGEQTIMLHINTILIISNLNAYRFIIIIIEIKIGVFKSKTLPFLTPFSLFNDALHIVDFF